MAASNALKEKILMFAMVKFAKPRWFNHVPYLPCQYRGQKKAWMDGNDIEEWPRERDRKFKRKGQKIIIIVDNFPAHPEIKGLKSIDLHFFPCPVLNTRNKEW